MTAQGHSMPLSLVSRGEWGCAGEPLERIPLPHPIKSVCVAYNTAVRGCKTREECAASMRAMHKAHVDLGYSDIFYNFCVGGDGSVYEGRGWHARHAKVLNFVECYGSTVVIGIIGDAKLETRRYAEPYEALYYMMRLITEGIQLKYLKQDYSLFEDHRTISPCTMPNC